MKEIKERLEYLRQCLREEEISYEELAELQSLAKYIDPGDVELLEAAGVPEQACSLEDMTVGFNITSYWFMQKNGEAICDDENGDSRWDHSHDSEADISPNTKPDEYYCKGCGEFFFDKNVAMAHAGLEVK